MKWPYGDYPSQADTIILTTMVVNIHPCTDVLHSSFVISVHLGPSLRNKNLYYDHKVSFWAMRRRSSPRITWSSLFSKCGPCISSTGITCDLLKLHILGPHPRPPESREQEPALCFNKHSRDSDACLSLRAIKWKWDSHLGVVGENWCLILCVNLARPWCPVVWSNASIDVAVKVFLFFFLDVIKI